MTGREELKICWVITVIKSQVRVSYIITMTCQLITTSCSLSILIGWSNIKTRLSCTACPLRTVDVQDWPLWRRHSRDAATQNDGVFRKRLPGGAAEDHRSCLYHYKMWDTSWVPAHDELQSLSSEEGQTSSDQLHTTQVTVTIASPWSSSSSSSSVNSQLISDRVFPSLVLPDGILWGTHKTCRQTDKQWFSTCLVNSRLSLDCFTCRFWFWSKCFLSSSDWHSKWRCLQHLFRRTIVSDRTQWSRGFFSSSSVPLSQPPHHPGGPGTSPARGYWLYPAVRWLRSDWEAERQMGAGETKLWAWWASSSSTTTFFILSLTCSSLSAAGRFLGFFVREVLTNWWKFPLLDKPKQNKTQILRPSIGFNH